LDLNVATHGMVHALYQNFPSKNAVASLKDTIGGFPANNATSLIKVILEKGFDFCEIFINYLILYFEMKKIQLDHYENIEKLNEFFRELNSSDSFKNLLHVFLSILRTVNEGTSPQSVLLSTSRGFQLNFLWSVTNDTDFFAYLMDIYKKSYPHNNLANEFKQLYGIENLSIRHFQESILNIDARIALTKEEHQTDDRKILDLIHLVDDLKSDLSNTETSLISLFETTCNRFSYEDNIDSFFIKFSTFDYSLRKNLD